MPRAIRPSSPHKKEVRIDMPPVSITCPYCGKEDDHENIFEPGGDYVLGVGVTFCESCDQWFDVVLQS